MPEIITNLSPHPDSFIDHYAHTGVGRVLPFPGRLHLVTVLNNPLRYHSRYHNYWKFAKHLADSGVILHTVELAYGDRHFEITDPQNPLHIQLRTRHELWHKENLLNIGFQRLPLGIQYFGYSDADMQFTRSDWAQEALHQLQHFDAVQLFSSYSDLDSNHRVSPSRPSFAYNYLAGKCVAPGTYGSKAVGAVGGAWAFRAEAFSALGGMLDICILGSGDWHMAMGLARRDDQHADIKTSPAYAKAIRDWQANAAGLNANIGVIDCHALHSWHGNKKNRGYGTRPAILKKNVYDPTTDIRRDYQGVYQLSGNKPKFRDDLRAYFRSRDEDAPTFYSDNNPG